MPLLWMPLLWRQMPRSAAAIPRTGTDFHTHTDRCQTFHMWWQKKRLCLVASAACAGVFFNRRRKGSCRVLWSPGAVQPSTLEGAILPSHSRSHQGGLGKHSKTLNSAESQRAKLALLVSVGWEGNEKITAMEELNIFPDLWSEFWDCKLHHKSGCSECFLTSAPALSAGCKAGYLLQGAGTASALIHQHGTAHRSWHVAAQLRTKVSLQVYFATSLTENMSLLLTKLPNVLTACKPPPGTSASPSSVPPAGRVQERKQI